MNLRIVSRLAATGLAALALSTSGSSARAQFVVDVDTLLNGSSPIRVNNALPFGSVTFTNAGTDVVNVKLDITNLNAGQFIDTWMLDFDGDATALQFDNPPLAPLDNITTASVRALDGGSSMKAGLFDIQLEFNTANNKDRFEGGETYNFTFTAPGLTEDMFDLPSADDGRIKGGWLSAFHVQGIPSTNGTTSGSVAGVQGVPPTGGQVPEPGAFAFLGGLAAAGAGLIRRRRA